MKLLEQGRCYGSLGERGIQAGSTGAGCKYPDEIQQQALIFNLSFKIQRNLFSLDWAQVLPVTGIELL